MGDKIATREGYGQMLIELGRQHEDIIVFDADLANATRTGKFKDVFPDRHFNCGIAEQNMMSAAAGAASMGLTAFVSTFAMFAIGRGFEQIRNSIGYTQLNVKIAASHAGISVGEDGASHQCCEDMALMRSIPGMVVMCPADNEEAKAAVKAAYEYKGPVYIRLGRLPIPVFHKPDMPFAIGKGEVLQDGKDVAIIATGLMTYRAMQAGELLRQKGVHARVINLCTVKPLDEELILNAAAECERIVTCEEHSIIGGLGEAVCALLSEKMPVQVKRMGINDVFGYSGPAEALLEEFGLTAENIAHTAMGLCGGK